MSKVSEPHKLSASEMHVLKLIRKEADANGWATVSKVCATLFSEGTPWGIIPRALCEFESIDGGDGRGRARLTVAGNALLDSMAWL